MPSFTPASWKVGRRRVGVYRPLSVHDERGLKYLAEIGTRVLPHSSGGLVRTPAGSCFSLETRAPCRWAFAGLIGYDRVKRYAGDVQGPPGTGNQSADGNRGSYGGKWPGQGGGGGDDDGETGCTV